MERQITSVQQNNTGVDSIWTRKGEAVVGFLHED
jgi:hypothetical protein